MKNLFLPGLLLAIVLLATACSSSARKPDNREWMPVSCSIFMQRWNTCHAEAHALCPDGYDIYNVVYSEAEQRRKMMVACKQ
jgi:hypothetical protein